MSRAHDRSRGEQRKRDAQGSRGASGSHSSRSEEAPSKEAPATSVPEWVIAGTSILLLVGLIGFIVLEGVRETGAPPEIRVEVVEIAPAAGGYLVRFRAINEGDLTAKGLSVEAELKADTGIVETASTAIDYVPGGGRREAGLFFERDPREYQLKVRPKGYDLP